MSSYIQRLIGAARLDPATYEEVEADPTATGAALGTVVLASLAAAVGATGGDAGHAPARSVYERLGFRPLPAVQYFRAL